MHVISLKRLREFWSEYPDAEEPLRAWHRIVEAADWQTFADVREVYRSADLVGKFVVFNIGGNKYRLVAAIHFNRGKVFIRHVLTHKEYDSEKWKDD
ncbi:MAG TPA: type II toxin-antitoxin system HigB family toxin [Gemmataceae bacterium]|jgi:mRNA interferase HigB